MKTALSIAGSDSSGGAGIQADIKTMIMHGVYAMTAITALTAQNTLGVSAISEVTTKFLMQQLDAVFTDIFPDAVKTGMVPSASLVEVIGDRLRYYHAQNVVVDPVMVATSGSILTKDSAVSAMQEKLFPIATLITPNIPEAEVLIGQKINSQRDMASAAEQLAKKFGCAVLCKGGHSVSDANDVLYADGELTWFGAEKIDNSDTHGTGCTLSSAIAANLAKGYITAEAVRRAKEYVKRAIASKLRLGHGHGPIDRTVGYAGV